MIILRHLKAVLSDMMADGNIRRAHIHTPTVQMRLISAALLRRRILRMIGILKRGIATLAIIPSVSIIKILSHEGPPCHP